MADPRYPIGKLELKGVLSGEERGRLIDRMAALPAALRSAVEGLDDAKLDTPYREGGWSVRQVVHHIADSHLNATIRFKLTLTEDQPPVKGYDENAWARLADHRLPIEPSLALIEPLHLRLVTALRATPPHAWQRTCVHTEKGRQTLDDLLCTYAWHGHHHVAHITTLRQSRHW